MARQLRKWLSKLGTGTLYIEPGSSWENGYCESFNGKLRDEYLNGEIFYSLKEAQIVEVRATLPHEMAHADTPEDGLGALWQGEIRKLIRLTPAYLKAALQFDLEVFELAPTMITAPKGSRDQGWYSPSEPYGAGLLAEVRPSSSNDGRLATRLRAWYRDGQRVCREEARTPLIRILWQIKGEAERTRQLVLPLPSFPGQTLLSWAEWN